MNENYEHFESRRERKHMLSGFLILVGFIVVVVFVILLIGYAVNYYRAIP